MRLDGSGKAENSTDGELNHPPDSRRRDDARLGQALARTLDGEASPGACPSDQTLADLLAGQAGAAGRRELLAHAARCDRCRDTLRLARALEAEAPPEASDRRGFSALIERPAASGHPSWFGRGPLLGVAAALAVALLGSAWLLHLTLPPAGGVASLATVGEIRLSPAQQQLALTLPGGVIRERDQIESLLSGFDLAGHLHPGGGRELRVAGQPGAVKCFPVHPERLRYACRDGVLHLVITVE